jgi:hypothetical protein
LNQYDLAVSDPSGSFRLNLRRIVETKDSLTQKLTNAEGGSKS